MFGFILGTVCLIGLVKVLRHGRGWHGYGHAGAYGHDCGPGYYGGGYGRGGFDGGPRRWMLRRLFERLETTPGQEKAILAALDELREERRGLREEMEQTRGDLGRAVASGLIDDASMQETFARHDRLLARLRVGFVEAMKKVTDALDERQRKQVADLLQGGFRGWGGGFRGPYRGGMWA
jgi:Spy/CpxP family protein refolding chaperone